MLNNLIEGSHFIIFYKNQTITLLILLISIEAK